MELKTKRLNLAEITPDDLETVHRLYRSPEVDEFNTMGLSENIEATRKIVEAMILAQVAEPRVSYSWKIVRRDTGEIIGMAGISLSGDRFRRGEIWYELFPEQWGVGFATEAAKVLIATGFEAFGLHRIEAGVATRNVRSVRVLEKAGMTREGIRRKILPIRGEWKDNFHYAILEDDPR